MNLASFLNLCQICHFQVSREWLTDAECSSFFDLDQLHEFDLFLVEWLSRPHRMKTRDDFWRQAITLAKRVYGELSQAPELIKEITKFGSIDMKFELGDALRKRMLAVKKKHGAIDDFSAVSCECMKQVRDYDNVWKSRFILARLDKGSQTTIDHNSIGETRYALVVYGIYYCLGKYHSFCTGKSVPSLLVTEKIDKLSPYSICKFCGAEMQDFGESPRVHCGLPSCKRDYERSRKANARKKSLERRAESLRRRG